MTTDNAGNAFTSAAITVRVDNTAPDRRRHRPGRGARTSAARSRSRATPPIPVPASPPSSSSARRPAPARWTNQAASWDTTTVADGLYDLRVTTTDNAGNAFTSAAITIRVDNTLPTGSVTAPGERRRDRRAADRR